MVTASVARAYKPERTLQTNSVVPGRINAAVRDTDVPAAVDVHAIAIRVDHQVVDREVVGSRREDSKMSFVEDGKVAQRHVVAIL